MSDHVLLCLKGSEGNVHRRKHFKFPNVIAETDGFWDSIKANWDLPLEGRNMLRF